MNTRITALLVTIATLMLVAGTAFAQSGIAVKKTNTQGITDTSKARAFTTPVKFEAPAPSNHYIEYLAANPENDEIIALTIDVNGRVTYSHTRGGNPLITRDAIDIQVIDRFDPETVRLAFGVMAASGFMKFPREFPNGGTYKADFNVWVTVQTPTDSNTVYADAESLVSKEFQVVRSVMDSLTQTLEDQTLLDLSIYHADGTLAGGIVVQNDGDAVLRRHKQEDDEFGVSVFERHLSNVKMHQIRTALDTAEFFQLPACSGTFQAAGYSDPYEFTLECSMNGVSNSIRFGSGSEAAQRLAFIVDWGLDLVD